ncbi:MAG TPA: hypothetical protein VLT35_00050 [Methanocella sp.]|nr:hypothetical protein [Methanocella sp.]
MSPTYALKPGEIIFLSDGTYTVGAVKAGGTRHVFIETDAEELVQFLEEDDLLAASAFAAGEGARRSIACILYLVREGGMPLLVLPKGHPGTRRLPLVLSAGPEIRLSSCIVPGTHPEQDVLCGRGALDGVVLRGTPGGVAVEGGDEKLAVEISPYFT